MCIHPSGFNPCAAQSYIEEFWLDPQLFTFQVLRHTAAQADRYFQVLTKAVGMRE